MEGTILLRVLHKKIKMGWGVSDKSISDRKDNCAGSVIVSISSKIIILCRGVSH